jgi:D-serine deaminase-like pyridoxal phosphate-dependent protein
MNSVPTIPLFSPGQIVATPGALALLEKAHKSPAEFLLRHLKGDWGELCQEDKTENELSLKHGFRLLSSYPITDTDNLWIITEADRSMTTLLLPVEY